MSGNSPGSLLDRLLGACLVVLVAAVAVSAAVHRIEAVWTSLLAILIAGGIVTLGVLVVRARSRGW